LFIEDYYEEVPATPRDLVLHFDLVGDYLAVSYCGRFYLFFIVFPKVCGYVTFGVLEGQESKSKKNF